ncbi:MAG: methyltransferase domain-containing protein [bacterium]|nr:methyltransferase domain-containing protein [bacterium]
MNFLRKFFLGYVVLEKTETSFNGKIEVRDNLFGGKTLVVGGLSQSGGKVEWLWKKALRELKNLVTDPPAGGLKNILILGLGAGSVAHLITNFCPEAKITGVEIDSEMIRLGKKYFKLDKNKNLEIKIADAFETINNQQLIINHYDLVLVDIYVGDQVPERVESDTFLKKIAELKSPVIFNRLYYGKKKEKTEGFSQKLKKFFTKIEAKKIGVNKLFLCRN